MSKSTDTILKVKGKTFRCSRCGANVFSKGRENGLWICNGCKTEYVDENYKPIDYKSIVCDLLKDNVSNETCNKAAYAILYLLEKIEEANHMIDTSIRKLNEIECDIMTR